MAYTYTSGIYLHLEGTDSEVASIQKKRELTWAKDLEALRYLDCSGVPHYIYSSSLDLSGVIQHMNIVNLYGTGLWTTKSDQFIEPLRNKHVYVSGVQWIGPNLDQSKILPYSALGEASVLYLANTSGEPTKIESFTDDGSTFTISRNVYNDPTSRYIADGSNKAIEYIQVQSSTDSYHMFNAVNGSTVVSSGDAVSWTNTVIISPTATYINYLNKDVEFQARSANPLEPMTWNNAKLSLGFLELFKTPPERLSISGAIYLSGVPGNSENGTIQFNPAGYFLFRESGVWRPLGGNSVDTNTTYTGVLPIHISGVLGSDLGVKLLYTDEFTVNAQGQLSIDYDNFRYYDSKSVTIEAPISGDCVTLFYTDEAMTIQSVHGALCQSGNVYWNIRHDGDHRSSAGTLLTSSPNQVYWNGTGTNLGSHVWSGWADATISGNSWVWLEIPQNTSYDNEETPLTFHLTVNYRKD